jgi:hypothetical protein
MSDGKQMRLLPLFQFDHRYNKFCSTSLIERGSAGAMNLLKSQFECTQILLGTRAAREKRRGKNGDFRLQKIGAVERIRTFTVLLPPAPQAGASASSATTAKNAVCLHHYLIGLAVRSDCPFQL